MEMLRFTAETYAHCLGGDEREFLRRFHALPHPAQCLFIRMANRKAGAFYQRNLSYPEIDAINDAIALLLDEGFAARAHEGDYFVCLMSLGKPELLSLAEALGQPVKTSWDKRRLSTLVAQHLPFEQFTAQTGGFIRPARLDHVGYLSYLYFGKPRDNLTSFTLRDLGLIPVEQRTQYTARFVDEEEARSSYYFVRLMAQFDTATDEKMAAFADAAPQFPRPQSLFANAKRNQALYALGQFFDKRKDVDRAISIYALGDSGDCRERLVRLAYACGRHDEAQGMLENILADPASDLEYLFAEDFYARKYNQRRTGPMTQALRDARQVFVDDLYRGSPEHGAIDLFAQEGWQAHHTENGLWTALFALLFWEELFETASSLASPFDRYPSVLKYNRFPVLFAREIADRLAMIRAGDAPAYLRQQAERKYGLVNSLFYWDAELPAFLDKILSLMPAEALAHMIGRMAGDFDANFSGFPDLTLMGPRGLKFVEVKSEGDQLQRHQLLRIQQLKEAGLEVEICRLGYHVNPDQIFTVVDIETTGGMSSYDSVTEIGAVKIQGGRVIGEWQTLVNPGRPIPAFITELTGITNDMVADAPKFADVAADFAAFLKGSVFVAHNVNFDYGFLKEEFARLEQPFKYPKLCTVSGMRRHYPGHASYSLAAITREYGISLRNHHRAMADARAAAELLNLINDKRMATQEQLRKTA